MGLRHHVYESSTVIFLTFVCHATFLCIDSGMPGDGGMQGYSWPGMIGIKQDLSCEGT